MLSVVRHGVDVGVLFTLLAVVALVLCSRRFGGWLRRRSRWRSSLC